MRKEDNQAEYIVADLLVHQFNQNRLRYEAITLEHNGYHAVPDFNVTLDNICLVIEVTQAPLTILYDPKRKQRNIIEAATLGRDDLAWMILYLQHCVTAEGLSLASASLDLLVNGQDSRHVQSELDYYALHCKKCPKIRDVDWNELRSEVFPNSDKPKIYFW
jgi:hypothetical protein